VAGVDIDDGTHAGAKRRFILIADIDVHLHRHALHDLDPVALVFCAGSSENSCAAAGLTLSTVPFQVTPG